jgi:hypothetical protein
MLSAISERSIQVLNWCRSKNIQRIKCKCCSRVITCQLATVTDNSSDLLSKNDVVYSKNFFVPTPQNAYTIGLDYRSPQFWFINVNFNFFDKMYLDFNPVRRTEAASSGVEVGSELWHDIIDQKQLDNQYTLDAFAGYSWMMNRKSRDEKKDIPCFQPGRKQYP